MKQVRLEVVMEVPDETEDENVRLGLRSYLYLYLGDYWRPWRVADVKPAPAWRMSENQQGQYAIERYGDRFTVFAGGAEVTVKRASNRALLIDVRAPGALDPYALLIDPDGDAYVAILREGEQMLAFDLKPGEGKT